MDESGAGSPTYTVLLMSEQSKRKREDQGPQGSAVIVGAGTVGLSTALVLKQSFPSLDVTIVADCFYAQTTSFGSGLFVSSCRISSRSLPKQDFNPNLFSQL